MDYRSAGVDISKNDFLVTRIKEMMGSAGIQIGHFGGTIEFPVDKYRKPLLVSSIDSAGTKTTVAIAMNRHEGIGRDILHHCINDIACCGAEPLYFLDYIAMGNLNVGLTESILKGLIDGSNIWGVQLAGGEMAEMPGVYRENEYDLVLSITGVVEKEEKIDGKGIVSGDVLIGFPSAGLHTNGFSLARKVVEESDLEYSTVLPGLKASVGLALLAEHRCYLNEIRELKQTYNVKGLAHITGGGLTGNVSRIIPEGLSFRMDWDSISEPPIFDVLRTKGEIPEAVMRETFNLGVGLVAIVSYNISERVLKNFPSELCQPFKVGEVYKKES